MDKNHLLDLMCRHLVALAVAFRAEGDDLAKPARVTAFSGTLLMLDHDLYWFTAGHVIEELEKLRSDPRVTIINTRLIDNFGRPDPSRMPIPFSLADAELLSINQADLGLDFGIIPLQRSYVRLLAAGDALPIMPENWRSQNNGDFDAYFILGLPDEKSAASLSPSGDAVVCPTLIRVIKIDAPADVRPTAYPRFVGQIEAPREKIGNVVGMSGGPIFGIKTLATSQHVYWIVAIQSSWLPDRRIAFGCPITTLESLVTARAKVP